MDDSRAFVAGLKKLASEAKVTIRDFLSAKTAIEQIKSHPPDIIVCDLEMPEMDGFTFIDIIRTETSLDDIPILVITSNENSDVMKKAIMCGADGFITKNMIRDTFVAHIYALARIRNTHKNVRQKQLSAIKSLIGTYKHNFGNIISVIMGKIRKIEKTVPELSENEHLRILKEWSEKLEDVLKKLNELQHYQEEAYSQNETIIKIG